MYFFLEETILSNTVLFVYFYESHTKVPFNLDTKYKIE